MTRDRHDHAARLPDAHKCGEIAGLVSDGHEDRFVRCQTVVAMRVLPSQPMPTADHS
jgi:hypothetical protein